MERRFCARFGRNRAHPQKHADFDPRQHVEHQQVGPWPMAAVEDAGIDDRVTIELLHKLGTTEPCTTLGI